MIRTKFPLICGFFIISTMFAVPVFRSGPAMYTIMQAGSPDLSEITILSRGFSRKLQEFHKEGEC